MASPFLPTLSSLTKTAGGGFHEGWGGGDFFVEKGDEFIVKKPIAIIMQGITKLFEKGDILKIEEFADDYYVISWKNHSGKYKIDKTEFEYISYKLMNKN